MRRKNEEKKCKKIKKREDNRTGEERREEKKRVKRRWEEKRREEERREEERRGEERLREEMRGLNNKTHNSSKQTVTAVVIIITDESHTRHYPPLQKNLRRCGQTLKDNFWSFISFFGRAGSLRFASAAVALSAPAPASPFGRRARPLPSLTRALRAPLDVFQTL